MSEAVLVLLLALLTAVATGLGALPFLFVEVFRPLLPYGLGFAAGAMAWMVFAELLPDARKEAPARLVVTIAALSVLAMLAFQVLVR
jgi:ZIP family zinc transporter